MKVIETEIEGLEGVETDVGWMMRDGIAAKVFSPWGLLSNEKPMGIAGDAPRVRYSAAYLTGAERGFLDV